MVTKKKGLLVPKGGFTPNPEFQSVPTDKPSVTTRKGDEGINPPLPEGTQVPFVDVQTGRRTGLGIVGGRSFFGLTGEELALLERQQKEKGAVSGSVTQQAFQQTQQTALLQAQQAAGTLPRENLALGPFGPSNQLGIVTAGLRELSTTRLLKDVKNGLATPEEIAMLGLTPQDVQTLQAGKANVNALGQIAERIPIVGGRLRLGAGFSLSLSDLLGGPSKIGRASC